MGFPTDVWDGLSLSRDNRSDYNWPTPEDWAAITTEVIAMQTNLLGGVTLTPAAIPGVDPPVVEFNDALTLVTKDLIVAIGDSAVASVDLGYDIPAASIVLGAAMNIETVVTLGTATKIGLGIVGTLNKYGSITGGTKNNKSTVAITPTAIASAEDVKIYATDNSSAAAGTIQNGSIRVRLTLLTQAQLADA